MNKDLLEACGITLDTVMENLGDRIIEEFDLHNLITRHAEEEINKRIDSLFQERVNDLIDSKVEEIMESAFSLQITPVDQWGDPQGKPFTIRDRIYDEAVTFWEERVNSSGDKYTVYDAKRQPTRAQFLIEKAVAGEIEKAVKLSAQEATAIFREALKKSQTAWVVRQIDNLVK